MDQLHRPLDHFFDGHTAYLDFTRELRRMRYGHYPERDFFTALRRAELRDTARWLVSLDADGDDEYFARQPNYQSPSNPDDGFDPRWLDDRSILHQATGATFLVEPKSSTGLRGRPRTSERKSLVRTKFAAA